MSHAPLLLAASSGSDTASGVGIPLALAAGLVSFLSPCVLPLVPGYLSTVIGVTPADLNGVSARRVLIPSLLFIASFSAIFILLGLSATVVGSALNAHKRALEHRHAPLQLGQRSRLLRWGPAAVAGDGAAFLRRRTAGRGG